MTPDDRLATWCEGRELWQALSRPIRQLSRATYLIPLPFHRMGLTNANPDTDWGITVD